MNTSALKSFAPTVRRQLMEAVGRKLDYVLSADTADLRAVAAQVKALRWQAQRDRAGLVERVAYTWFNRLAALRFLDAHGWHPFGCHVLTPATAGETQPDLLKLVRSGRRPAELVPFTDLARMNDLLDGRLPPALPGADPQGEVYRQLILATCRYYHDLMPFLFEPLDDETELLLPDDLLTERSIAQGFRTEISDGDCGEVEVLGWLYQFYISEKKDEVMARKRAVPSEDIPAVTQLFTPHWIVRYLVENSLGRLWLLNHPASKLREYMPYYIDAPETETDFLMINTPEDILMLDPACGSGHMLAYGFDLLYRIYEEEGYAPSEIAGKILTHNLHGLEICPRATQLAQFALVCKAREKSRTAFRRPIQPKVMCLQDVVIGEDELVAWLRATRLSGVFDERALAQVKQFGANTSMFGSLIQPVLTAEEIAALKAKVGEQPPPGELFLQQTQQKIRLSLDQAEMLSERYHVVVGNPPYMGTKYMIGMLREFARDHFPDSKSDLFAMFIERGLVLSCSPGFVAMVTMESWMFLPFYEVFRRKLLKQTSILSMVHMPYLGRGGTSMGINFGTAATIFRNSPVVGLKGHYQCIRYFECDDHGVPHQFPTQNDLLKCVTSENYQNLPGSPIAYYFSDSVFRAYRSFRKVSDYGETASGLQTSDNGRFLRQWFEVPYRNIEFLARSKRDSTASKRKWYPHKKGGPFRKWYGNNDYVLNWKNDGEELREFASSLYGSPTRIIKNTHRYYQSGVTWSHTTSSRFSARLLEAGFIFNVESPSLFGVNEKVFLPFLCSNVCSHLIELLNPTMHFVSGSVGALPFELSAVESKKDLIIKIAEDCIILSALDWNSSETSWDFSGLPVLLPELKGRTLEVSWHNWAAQLRDNLGRMQALETDNNRLWIEAYDLQNELSPEVPEEEITLARPDPRKDIAAFLSYAVGCMMGRYSLDKPGLILADAGDTLQNYLAKVGKPLDQLTFAPDADGIIPVLNGEWFEDDVVARTRDFLRATFGAETLEENIRFIEESLGKDLRKYFLTDFYRDHLQTYKKRPIYWLFHSPKKGFQCLVYLHRYTRDTANRMLNHYLREYLVKLRARIGQLDHELAAEGLPARERTRLRKESDQLRKTLHECEDWERATLLPLAQQRIELDLDDGVKVNYLKLGDALAPIPGLAAEAQEDEG